MNLTTKLAIAGATALTLAGCSAAPVALPSEVRQGAEVLPITGMGIGRRGDFDFAGGQGRFTRGADRLAIFDPLLVRYSGAGTFRFDRPGVRLEGACRYRQKDVAVGAISVTTRPFTYECRFGRNGAEAGGLVIEEVRGTTAAAMGREARRGFVELDGVRLDISSIHKLEGAGLATNQPLGYRFEANGRPVGAVDLNGTTKTVYAPPVAAQREAVFAGSLALSVLWDPVTL
jgi:hypothetical protein